MTQQEKQLLLKDLSARLPYGVKIIDEPAHCLGELFLISTTDMVEYETETDTGMQTIYNIKPYLRPMSSMTEDERKEINKSYNFSDLGSITICYHMEGWWDNDTECSLKDYLYLIDWFNEHHFDYRGLVEKGLALEAPEGMYKND